MCDEFAAVVEQDGPWYIAYCEEVPGANGQGATREECLANLREAITLVRSRAREQEVLDVLDEPSTGSKIVDRLESPRINTD